MNAIVFKKPGKYVYEDRPKPQIKKDDEVLIKVLGVGICGTDLHVLMDPPLHPAKPNIILGHEYCGEIVEVGPAVDWLNPGDKVVVDPHPPCGSCRNTGANSACPWTRRSRPKSTRCAWPLSAPCG